MKWTAYTGQNLSTKDNVVDKYLIQILDEKTGIENIEIGFYVMHYFMDPITGKNINDRVVAFMDMPRLYKG